MDPGLLSAILSASTLVTVLALRRLSYPIRLAFDLLCLSVISLYLLKIGVSPFLDAPDLASAGNILSLRIIACAWWLLGARVLIATLWFTLHRNSQSRAARLSSDVTGAVIYVAAIMVIVKSVLALPLSGVLATSGLLAVVIGLALQNTLGDVFAGIAVGIESPFKVGDRIVLADRLEGQVVQVNWRAVWIQTDDNDVAIIPNSLVAKSQLINRSYPSQRRSISVELPCPATAPPERVIETLSGATWLCPAILRTPAPSAVLVRLGRRSHHYAINFSVNGTPGLTSTKGTLLRQAHRQLHYAGLLLRTRPPDEVTCERSQPAAALLSRRLLEELILFERLDTRSLDHLVEELTLVDLEPGEVLFAEHAVDATLYIVAGGIVQLVRGLGSAEADTIGSIGAGDYVGENGLLTGAAHAVTATALTPCRVYKLSRDALAPLLADNADLASAFDKSVRRGLSILHRDVAIRASGNMGPAGQLSSRIRAFFNLDAG